ncbi:MAG: hypothetical protein KAQ94_10250 [Arcobacteraceae bacterium]|nr:hypothetical protein [Arcobacteraceae bacterium]
MNKIMIFIFVLLLFSSHSYAQDTNALKKLTKTMSIIERHYIKKVEMHKLIDLNKKYNTEKEVKTALKKLMDKLDKYSLYVINGHENKKYPKKLIMQPFSSKIIDKKYLYIKIPYFDSKVVTSLIRTIISSTKETQAIILDLRDNPGGLFKEAIKTVDVFVDDGVIVSKKGRDMQNVTTFRATLKKTITTLPLIILVNKKSASSAEIVSGALQDLKRATIIGEKTFGKGTIQALIYITDDKTEAIKLTVAKYYLPSGRLVDNKIIPDIEILDNQLDYAIRFLNNI